MLILIESSAGYAVFQLHRDLDEIEDVYSHFLSDDGINKLVKLEKFFKFQDTKEGVTENVALMEGKVTKKLKKIIKKMKIIQLGEKLIVTDNRLGKELHDKLNVSVVTNSNAIKIRNCIMEKFQMLTSIPEEDRLRMSLGLSHSLNRYKLKCNPDKIDTMIVQAIAMLDDLDKQSNNYVMRCKEIYGWHFPELAKIVTDNTMYIALVRLIGRRENALTLDLSGVLTEDLIEPVKDIAKTSCGNEITEEDQDFLIKLCDMVTKISESRAGLYEYLKRRMLAVAPNLTMIVGEILGARLIAHAGTLMNLAKHPSSTIQILGAEKALFRALKTKHQTPKFGLLFHASLVGQASLQNKGKISRVIANKAALAARYDALGEESEEMNAELGIKMRTFVETTLKALESGKYVKKGKRPSLGGSSGNQKKARVDKN